MAIYNAYWMCSHYTLQNGATKVQQSTSCVVFFIFHIFWIICSHHLPLRMGGTICVIRASFHSSRFILLSLLRCSFVCCSETLHATDKLSCRLPQKKVPPVHR